MSHPQSFTLTRHAALILRDIYEHSRQTWGEKTANAYLETLYTGMKQAAATPQHGHSRAHRSTPFLMLPAGQHFLVYEPVPEGILVVTLLHQRQDIERIIANATPHFWNEIKRYRKQNHRRGAENE